VRNTEIKDTRVKMSQCEMMLCMGPRKGQKCGGITKKPHKWCKAHLEKGFKLQKEKQLERDKLEAEVFIKKFGITRDEYKKLYN
jgi:hypothetical protein